MKLGDVTNATITNPTSHHDMVGRWARILVSCSVLLILINTLFPYNFSFKETAKDMSHNFLIFGWGESGEIDVVKNIFLFLPLGLAVTCQMQKRGLKGLRVLPVVLVASIGFSYAIEVLQSFLPARGPSLIDVLSNGAGGLIGFLCYCLWGDRVLNRVSTFKPALIKKKGFFQSGFCC